MLACSCFEYLLAIGFIFVTLGSFCFFSLFVQVEGYVRNLRVFVCLFVCFFKYKCLQLQISLFLLHPISLGVLCFSVHSSQSVFYFPLCFLLCLRVTVIENRFAKTRRGKEGLGI